MDEAIPGLTPDDRTVLGALADAKIDNPRRAFVTLATASGRDISSYYRGADLRDRDLRNQDLTDVALDWADLRGSDLRGARLQPDILHTALLEGARISRGKPTGPDRVIVWVDRWSFLFRAGHAEKARSEARDLLASRSSSSTLSKRDARWLERWTALETRQGKSGAPPNDRNDSPALSSVPQDPTRGEKLGGSQISQPSVRKTRKVGRATPPKSAPSDAGIAPRALAPRRPPPTDSLIADWAQSRGGLGTSLWLIGERTGVEAGEEARARARATGLNEVQLRALLRAFAHEGVPVDQAEALLLKAAEELTSLRARLLSLTNADPRTRDLRTAAAAAIQAGELDRARDLVLQAAERHRRAGDELADSLRAHRLSESEALAEAAGLERSLSRLRESAALYERAADTARPFDPDAAWGHRLDQASALRRHGELFPGLDSLRQAVTALRDQALPLAPQESRPAQRATTQNNLGNALATLGERAGGEAGLAALDDAVAAFEAALRVRTEADMPAQWAMTQNNLGLALATLGGRSGGEAGLAALNDAVAAYEAALRVFTEADMPAQWATTQNNLGNALATLGERAGGEASLAVLNDAVAAYEAALRVRNEADMLADWAMTQNNLGAALRALGARAGGEAGLAALNQAVVAYEATLRVYTEADVPAHWATTQNNLGNALQILGARTGGEAGLAARNQAVAAYEAALRVRTEADMPADWAFTTENLALAEESLGAITRDPAPVRRAIDRMVAVISVFEAMQAGHYIDKARRNLAHMQALLAELEASS